MKTKQEAQSLSFKKERRTVMFALVAAITAANSIILLSPTVEDKNYYGNVIRPITAAVAVTFAAVVVCRQKTDGLFGRAYAGLATGLALWFIAEIIWGYNSIVLGIEVPFPSLADAFWLAGYAPLGFHLFSTSRLYGARLRNYKTMAVTGAVALFSVLYISSIISVSELTGPDALAATAITIAYPVFDAIIVIPAVVSILNSGKGELTAIPWIFISWVLTALADAIFGFTAVMTIAGEVSIWNLFYNAAYLFMAAGLYWHNKFFILSRKQLAQLCIADQGRMSLR